MFLILRTKKNVYKANIYRQLQILFMKNLLYLSLLILSISITSCSKSTDEILSEIAAENEQTILDYLSDNNLTAEKTASGLYYIIDVPGGNERPTLASTVEVIYRGYFVDGVAFDATPQGDSSVFPLSNVIAGWQEGIPLFGKGGSGVLLIPSALGYGTNGQGSIAPNEVLIFDINLIDF